MAKRIVTSDDVLKTDTLPKSVIVVGAGAVGVEFASHVSRPRRPGHAPRVPPGDRAARGPRREQGARAQLQRRGIKVITNARFDPQSVTRDENGICLMTGPEGKEPPELRAEKLLVAAGPGHQRRGRGARDHQGRGRPGHRQGRRPAADPRAASVRDRRHRRRADARAYGRARGHRGSPRHRGREGRPPGRLREAAARDVLPPRDRQSSASPSSSARSAASRSRSARCRSRPSPRRSSAGSTRASRRSSRTRRPTITLGIHLIGPHATDLIAEASVAFELEAAPWEIGGSTHPHPTLSEILGEAAMAVDGRSINF